MFLAASVVAQAKPTSETITLKEQVNQGYGPELVSYPFAAKDGACRRTG